MARSIWKGSITFGLVNIPVGLYGAETRDEVHFNLLDRRDMAPIHYQRVNAENGHEVPWEETVRGFEFEQGRYVVLSDADLARANPEATQTVDILAFVDLADIRPLYFDKPYYLAPEKQAAKSYALLRETLRRTGKAGIAKVVIRTKQHLAAMYVQDQVIVLDLLRFQHELRDPAELDLPSGRQGVGDKELEMATRLVESMVETWDPSRYRDDYQSDVKALIEQRVAAGQLESPDEAPAPRKPARGQVVDLMALLKRSVEASGKSKTPPHQRAAHGREPAAAAAPKSAAPRRKPAAAARRHSASKRTAGRKHSA